MHIEFQIQATALLASQKAALQTIRLCQRPVWLGPVRIVLERVEFGTNTLRHDVEVDFPVFLSSGQSLSIPGRQTQLAQEVAVWVTTMDEVVAHPNGAPATVVPIRGTVVMDLDVYAVGQETYFSSRFNRLEPGLLPIPPLPFPVPLDQLVQLVSEQLRALTARPAVPLGIIEHLPTRPSTSLPVNAGLSVDRHGRFIAGRVQVVAGALAADVPWRNFYQGFIADRLGGHEWSLFVDEKYICATIRTAIQRAVDEHLPENAQVFVGATYSNADGRARIDVDVLGLYDLPDPLGQLEAHPHVPVEISVPTQNTIQIDVGLPDLQTFVKSLIPHWLKVFIRIGGPAGAFVGAFIDSKISEIDEPELPDEIVRTSPHNLRFSRTIPLPAVPNGLGTRFNTVLALADGPAIAGRFNVRPFTTATLDLTMRPFELHAPEIDCGGAGMSTVAFFAGHPEAFQIITARVFVQYDGTLPVYICAVTPINDPLGAFPASAFHVDAPQTNATVVINPPVPPPSYYASPYPCDLLVATTVGTRLMRVPPPPVVTQEDVNRLRADMLVALGNCLVLVAPWWQFPHGYNPLWSVDPPDLAQPMLHLWEVNVNGLARDQMVSIVAAGQPLAVQRASVGPATTFSALITPTALETGVPELSIVRGTPQLRSLATETSPAAGPDQSARPSPASLITEIRDLDKPVPGVNKQGIAVRQTLLIREGRFSLGQACRRLLAARIAGRLCAVAVMEDGAVAVDVTSAPTPQTVAHWSVPGLRGAEPWEDGLLLFGDDGLLPIDAAGTRAHAVATPCDGHPVRAVTAGRNTLYVAHPHEVAVLSRRLCRQSTVPVDDCRTVLRVAGRLVAATAAGIVILKHPPHQPPARVECDDDWIATELRPAPPPHRRAFVALLEKGIHLLRLDDDDEVKSVGEYPTRPWFLDAVRIGSRLVRIVGPSLEIDRYSRSARI